MTNQPTTTEIVLNNMKIRKAIAKIGVVSLCVLLSSCGGEAKTTPGELSTEQEVTQQVIKDRIRNFKNMGAAFKGINDDFKAGTPTSTTVVYSAKSLARIVQNMDEWFPEGSGPNSGLKTRAKSSIWDDGAKFSALSADFQQSIIALNAAAQSGEAGAIKAGFYKAAKGCKTCHDLYREEE